MILKTAAVATVLASMGLSLMAQDWYRAREERFREEHWRGRVFEHVRVDLDHVAAVWAAPREKRRLVRTREELTDLQAKLQAGRYDEGELNDVIDSLAKSANDQRLSPRDRDMLNEDRNRLVEYRSHHENWR